MVNSSIGTPVEGDVVFNQAQQTLVVDFSLAFDDWLRRVNTSPSAPPSPGPSFADILKGEFTLPETRPDNTVELVYQLARLCRDFIVGDLYAWAFLQCRQGVADEAAMQSAIEHFARHHVEGAYARRWSMGLRALDGRRASRYGDNFYSSTERLEDAPWVRRLWVTVVDEDVPAYLDECLGPALERDEVLVLVEVTTRRLTEGRIPLKDFIEKLQSQDGANGPMGPAMRVSARSASRRAVIEPRLEAKGLSLTRWARKAGVDKSVPSDFLNGVTLNLRADNRMAMAAAIGIPLDQFPD